MMAQLLEDLKREEGWRERPYRDSESFLTIGYGFLIDERKPVRLPRKVGDYWLEVLAQEKWEALIDVLPWLVDQPEDVQRALGNMAYQMGVSGVLGFRRMLKALREGDREKAAEEALQSRWANQTAARARRVAALIRGGAE